MIVAEDLTAFYPHGAFGGKNGLGRYFVSTRRVLRTSILGFDDPLDRRTDPWPIAANQDPATFPWRLRKSMLLEPRNDIERQFQSRDRQKKWQLLDTEN